VNALGMPGAAMTGQQPEQGGTGPWDWVRTDEQTWSKHGPETVQRREILGGVISEYHRAA
jgi:hypothetical protein